MARQAFLITVNNAGNREAITAFTICKRIWIQESPSVTNWPTSDFETSDVASGGQAASYKAGTTPPYFKPQSGQFYPGDIAGYAALIPASPGASTTFQQIEDTTDAD